MTKERICRMSFSKDELSGVTTLELLRAGVSYKIPKTAQERDAMLDSFGWMDSNNKNVYEPGANASNIVPKSEDFARFPFRLISATTVAAGSWRAADFSKPGVLKKSVSMLQGVGVFTNHDTDEGNWAGTVENAKWSPERLTADGMTVPAGIDGMLAIDIQTNPKLVRALYTRGVYSNSVTVVFKWEPSHTFEDDYTFDNKVGQMGADGEMIRRIVTEIVDYYETSLVFLGADPFAKMVDENGDLVHIDRRNVYQKSLSLEPEKVRDLYSKGHKYSASMSIPKNILHLSTESVPPRESTNNPDIPMNKEVLAALVALTGVASADQLTPAHIAALTTNMQSADELAAIATAKSVSDAALSFMAKVAPTATDFAKFATDTQTEITSLRADKTTLTDKVTALEADKVELTGKVTTLNTEITTLTAQAAIGTKVVDNYREEVIRMYGISVGGATKEAILATLKTATMEQLEAFGAEYGAKAVASYGGKCTKCNSTEISFRQTTDSPGGKDTEIEKLSLTPAEIAKKYANSKLHGN